MASFWSPAVVVALLRRRRLGELVLASEPKIAKRKVRTLEERGPSASDGHPGPEQRSLQLGTSTKIKPSQHPTHKGSSNERTSIQSIAISTLSA